MRPVGGQSGIARQPQVGAIAVARHRGVGAALLGLLFPGTDGKHRMRAEIGFEHAVEQRLLRRPAVGEVVAVHVGGNHPAAQLSIKGQRARCIHLGAVVVPSAGRQLHVELGRGGGHLAHQIDRTTGIAGAVDQAGRAAHQLDAVVRGQVEHDAGVKAHADEHRRSAVELHAVDLEAARIDGRQPAVGVLDGDAHRLCGRLVQAGELLVVQALARDHRHRLGQLAQRLRSLAYGDGLGGVGVRALGLAVALPGHPHLAQRVVAGGFGSCRVGLHLLRLAQRVAAAFARHGFQAAAGQQLAKPAAQGVAALQARRGLAVREGGIKRQSDARCRRETQQARAQGAGWNVVRHAARAAGGARRCRWLLRRCCAGRGKRQPQAQAPAGQRRGAQRQRRCAVRQAAVKKIKRPRRARAGSRCECHGFPRLSLPHSQHGSMVCPTRCKKGTRRRRFFCDLP